MLDFSCKRLVEFHDRVAESIPCYPETRKTRSELNAQALPRLLITYLNYVGRSVPARPRTVFHAPDFWSYPVAQAHGGAILKLADKISSGADLSTYLSRDVRHKGFVGDRPGRVLEPEKDLILNGFGFHHLHLQERGRGDELVFVSFDRTSAVMVIAGNHKSFMDGSVAEAHARLQVLTGMHFKGATPATQPFDSRKQMVLARHGLGSMGQFDGKVTFGPVIMGSGHALRHTRCAHQICRLIKIIEPGLENRSYVASLFASIPERLQDETNFDWRMRDTDLVLIDRVSETGLTVLQGFC